MKGKFVQVISREIVKPLSQISNRLKKVKLSYLDQLIVPLYIPLIFFYKADESKHLTTSTHSQISQRLKQSLSNTLTSFYPLAGRVGTDHLSIDCNDAGAEFIEARRAGDLVDAIKDPNNTEELKQYIPMDLVGYVERPLLIIQITFFDCGGIALGIYFAHILADGTSIFAFLNALAAKCRGEPEVPQLVSFDLADYFPPREFPAPVFDAPDMSDEEFITKMFVFNKEILARLKQEVVSSPGSMVKDPTRVELISTFIWKTFLNVTKSRNPNSTKTCAAMVSVDLRGRKRPPQLLENVFGNCIMGAFSCASDNRHEEFHELVSKVRSSIRRIDDDYITESQTGNKYIDELQNWISLFPKGKMEWCSISSLCRAPLYELDYGFGSPIWFCTISTLEMKNTVIMAKSKNGENIEAWVKMEQHNLEMLETQINLLSG